MDCWIDVAQEPGGRLVRLAGRLGRAQVPDLLEMCAPVHGLVRIDLTDLLSADSVGIEALQRVQQKGADLFGVPEYIQLKLDAMAREARANRRPGQEPRS